MKFNLKLTRARLKNHFAYSAWKYLLSAVLIVFAWNMIYLATAYRPPENKKIEVYIQSSTAQAEVVDAYLKALGEKVTPDMEKVDGVLLLNGGAEDFYTLTQLTTYITAQEGDIYMLRNDDFKRFAAQGTFLELDSYIQSGALDLKGLQLEAGKMTLIPDKTAQANTPMVKQQFGIPAEQLKGLSRDLNIDSRGMMICVLIANGNNDNVIKFLNALVQQTRLEVQ